MNPFIVNNFVVVVVFLMLIKTCNFISLNLRILRTNNKQTPFITQKSNTNVVVADDYGLF